MTKIELGSTGAVVSPGETGTFIDTAAELEELGFETVWVTGGPLRDLGQITEVLRATKDVRVASGIIPIHRFGPGEVATLYAEMEERHPGRLVVGLGGAPGPRPMSTMQTYLDGLEAVPSSARVLAALGPQMLGLARDRASGALPVLVTPEYTRQARVMLGDDTTLAVEQLVVVESDPEQARAVARRPVGFLGGLPAYQTNLRRMGFTGEEIEALADRMVDAVVAWGDADAVAARVQEHRDAGADHVAVSMITAEGAGQMPAAARELAERLLR